ncbi:PQQ-dependent sugar dehydrogenase [Aurantibacter crassamenti]|uniref:PVC-type heme-binding CxxCH protein n=1 Tax=Aurantibacter crassamenti TaxID=1837375 RepID=UPI001939A6BC|nr:PVC-type heme-binding CxxCH protein [Aurantibacter crassamenti]MBM1105466.1 PQQ-dependent sugar dehydrogenase [Aurantibacter crassamenti]
MTIFCSCDTNKNRSTETEESIKKRYVEMSIEERRNPINASMSFVTPNGVSSTLFASEPSIINPTNIDIDHKGRIWVLESPNYSKKVVNGAPPKGRITILEDTDFDGKSDSSTVYYEGEDIHSAIGIAVLGNRVYVTRSPDILVFTDDNEDDKYDKIEKLFTGLGNPGDHSAHAITFGPDGKLYWNMGNYGGPVKDKYGKQVYDKLGNPVIPDGDKYIGGMIFRCNVDGSDFEVLGHNFRNNYEVAVDSYGNIWQSDNDDDGNQSCRLNYIIEQGNYGYLDEMTRESWAIYRTNMEEKIEDRHWHQNDPGVVPNLLVTGAGSPAGIMVYEGVQLPNNFQGKIFHADAGPNVVRVYSPKKNGAGFTADAKELVKSIADQWFRPVDVATAPDGSVFVADWYDPGVGGAAAADFSKGRIFRVSATNHSLNYPVINIDINSIDGAIQALESPNISTRYLGWNKLHSMGAAAESALLDLYNSKNQILRARSLWLLSKIKGKEEHYLRLASKDKNVNIRITAIRAAKQANVNFLNFASGLTNDMSIAVCRELAIGLHGIDNSKAAELWAKLALKHNGTDRWYLEALGVGAANNWKNCLSEYLRLINKEKQISKAAFNDVVWRSRDEKSLPLLVDIIKSDSIPNENKYRFFRAFNFLKFPSKQKYLIELLKVEGDNAAFIQRQTLQILNTDDIPMNGDFKNILRKTLSSISGTLEYVNLVDKFGLIDERQRLLTLLQEYPNSEAGLKASKLLIDSRFQAQNLVLELIKKGDSSSLSILENIGKHGGTKSSLKVLVSIIMDADYSDIIRNKAIHFMGYSWGGESELLNLVKSNNWDKKFNQAAASILFNAYRTEIQNEASFYIKQPKNLQGEPIAPIRDLLASIGNISKGKEVFNKLCATCHMLNDSGTDFGPKLSTIGSKLAKEGLYNAILYPNQAVNYDYQGVELKLKDGTIMVGLLESETKETITIKQIGGSLNEVLKTQIISKKILENSFMPNLATAMKESELIDLVEYLSSLIKP